MAMVSPLAPALHAVASAVASERALPAGLLPVAFSFGRRQVRLLDLTGVECRAQTFRQTVERLAAERPDRAPVEIDFATFCAAALQTCQRQPAGFVFNVARCGSTLLANMLAAPARHVVVKESGTVSVLMRRLLTAADDGTRRELEALLTCTLPLFGRLAGHGVPNRVPRLFVKPHSWATGLASTIARLFPSSPSIFLYREPAGVVTSMLAHAPFGGLYDQPRQQTVVGFPSLADAPAELSPAAFHAHLWRSPVEAALARPPDQLLLVDYAELTSDPAATLARVTRHFGIDPAPETIAQMLGATGVYAKDASGQIPFDGQGTHHRPPLNAAQHADVTSVVGDLYERLTARRQAQA